VEEVAAHVVCGTVAGGARCSLMPSLWHFSVCSKRESV
jgi:hypothetical protein